MGFDSLKDKVVKSGGDKKPNPFGGKGGNKGSKGSDGCGKNC